MLLNFIDRIGASFFGLAIVLLISPWHIQPSEAAPILMNVDPAHPFFIGRTNELELIREAIETSGKAIIAGLPGMGKSQLVRKYVDTYSSEYDVVS